MDNKENTYNQTYKQFVAKLRDLLEGQIELWYLNGLLSEKNEKLNAYLSEIKVLRGIIPICSFCKKIRSGEDYWEQVDAYLSKHTQAELSHGVCPEGAPKYYPE